MIDIPETDRNMSNGNEVLSQKLHGLNIADSLRVRQGSKTNTEGRVSGDSIYQEIGEDGSTSDLEVEEQKEEGSMKKSNSYIRNLANRPKKSLLSSSLAKNESGASASETNVTNIQNGRRQGIFNFGDNASVDKETVLDDHPEPCLRASSVTNDINGNMVPSLSNISLLSLNNYNSVSSEREVPRTSTSPGINNATLINVTPKVKKPTSLDYINQQRFPVQSRHPPAHQQSGQDLFSYTATPPSIPINKKAPIRTPDSPPLKPTSIGESPSGFCLSSQTPPRSLSGSYKNYLAGRKQTSQLLKVFNMSPLLQQNQFISRENQCGNKNSLSQVWVDGSRSPCLLPVLTPYEDIPMTPLYLNQSDVGYFENIN